MQQQCQQCGNVSDRPTRFCRQCGAQLFVENEATSATTRQYTPQQPANSPANPYDAPYQSQLAQAQSGQDRRFDNQTPDTSRLYHAPMAQNYPNYPANYQQAEAKKSSAWKWVLITLLCVVLVSGGIGAMVISAIRAKRADIEEQIRARVQEEIERVKREARHAAEEADTAVPSRPPLPPPPPGELHVGLERYKYPNAEVRGLRSVLGNEFAEMITSDSVSKVRDYYKRQLGDPMLEDEDSETVIFQIPGSPMILITINEDKEDSDKTLITMVRTNLVDLPKMN